ncbi:MAG: hypothetical protein LCH73_04250 [Proteobacteria bacterium]|nr:hypothetical protein [Pseudomonadota bacterium]
MRRRRTWRVLLGVVGLGTFAIAQQLYWRHQGEALFTGQAALPARLAGHADPLPVQAARCINCHGEGADRIGPLLSSATLTTAQARRGGPPSVYDERTLCRALREGVDPAQVTLTRAMPLYTAADADCTALWTFLSRQ